MALHISLSDADLDAQIGTVDGPFSPESYQHLYPGKLQGTGSRPSLTTTLERLESPPNPSVVIPFNQDRNFVDREDLSGQIYLN